MTGGRSIRRSAPRLDGGERRRRRSALASGDRRKYWRGTLEPVLILLLIGVLVTLVFAPQSERFCDVHKIGCSLLTGFISTALIAMGAYFLLFVWTLRQATRHYLDLARNAPERLFVTPPPVRADAIVGRERLTEIVANESAFARRGAPVLVVGEAGAGKTTFLLGLTRYLARRGVVPVPVSLRGSALPLNFRSLAEQTFLQYVDPAVRSEGDAQRIWRRLAAEGRIVVLADGLDETAPDLPGPQRDHVVRSALVTARNDRLSVVVTSRPELIPVGAQVYRFELGELDEDSALGYLEKRAPLRAASDRKALREIVTAGRITHSPFYLNVIAALYRSGRLPGGHSPARDALLVELLDLWMDLLVGGTLFQEVEIERPHRQRIIDDLSAIAYAMTIRSTLECTVVQLHEALDDPSSPFLTLQTDLGRLIEGAVRLELIDAAVLANDTRIRFTHSIGQAYFTSRLLGREVDAWRPLIAESASLEMMSSLVMWCASARDRDATATVTKALIERAEALDDDRALALVVTAAEVANSTGLGEVGPLGDPAEEAWGRASPQGRLAAVRRLRGRSDDWIHRTLYRRTRDSNYRVRWEAAQAIVEGGAAAYSVLREPLDATAECARSVPQDRWEESDKHDISVLGWILPALAGRVHRRDREGLEGHLRDLAALVPDGMPLGTEASLAQGFKLDAVTNQGGEVPGVVLDLLGRCAFWYARMVLLHAVCIACITDPDKNRRGLAAIRTKRRDEREHPFVRETARLCLKAIAAGEWDRYVWDDESAIIGQSGSAFADGTATLLADLVLLLNVTEQGIGDEREERKERTYRRDELPYCLSGSRDRTELFTACHERCDFNLCPYPTTTDVALARGELSQAFCRHQVEIRTGGRRVPWPARRDRSGWWTRSGRTATRRFWEMMESLAR